MTLLLQILCLVGFGSMVLTVLSAALSAGRHNQGLNFLFNLNRFRGWSRFFGGVTLVCFAALFAAFALTRTVADWQEAGICTIVVLFNLVVGSQLVLDGRRILSNYPR